jgi:hypothetical protein
MFEKQLERCETCKFFTNDNVWKVFIQTKGCPLSNYFHGCNNLSWDIFEEGLSLVGCKSWVRKE